MRNFKTIRQLRWTLGIHKISRDLSLRWVLSRAWASARLSVRLPHSFSPISRSCRLNLVPALAARLAASITLVKINLCICNATLCPQTIANDIIYLRAYIWYAIYYSSHICFYYTCFSFIYNRTIIQTSFRSSSSLPQAVPSAHHQGTLSVSPATRSQRALSIR